jgi:dTDP-4-amino-4,6-dideoxygalactose transaminase/nucleoside-diphosphate-sugar epimerase
MRGHPVVVVGGAGFVGSAVCRRLAAAGVPVISADRVPPPPDVTAMGVGWHQIDLLLDPIRLPDGDVVLVAGTSDPRPRRPWTLVLANAITTARLAPSLQERRVTHVSSAEVYGWAPAPLREDTVPRLPVDWGRLEEWCDEATWLARHPCLPEQAYPLARALSGYDLSGRWVYALSKTCQEILVRAAAPSALTILRPANLFGVGQERVISKLIRATLTGREISLTSETTRTFAPVEELADAITRDLQPGTYNVGSTVLTLSSLAERVMAAVGRHVAVRWTPPPSPDSCGVIDATKLAAVLLPRAFEDTLEELVRRIQEEEPPLFLPSIPVVTPPRPERPDLVAARHQEALWTGALKHGNRWTTCLTERLSEQLRLNTDRILILTDSGTSALRLGVSVIAGRARPGDAAVLPSFTFAATAEAVMQLGYRPLFCDVDASTWTMDPEALSEILQHEPRCRLVVPVDALGNPAPYDRISKICAEREIPMVADSAPSLGACFQGEPIGTQAVAHAFSMSFAKVVSAAGAGGAAVLPATARLGDSENWVRSSLMGELNAVAALDQLEAIDDLLSRRQRVAAVYDEVLTSSGIQRQAILPGNRHSWVHYVVRIPDRMSRDALADHLSRLGVHTKPYYAPLVHQMPGIRTPGRFPLPVTENLGPRVLALPMSSEMTVEQAERVGMALCQALTCRARKLRVAHVSDELALHAAEMPQDA